MTPIAAVIDGVWRTESTKRTEPIYFAGGIRRGQLSIRDTGECRSSESVPADGRAVGSTNTGTARLPISPENTDATLGDH
jgi:hypothetical protein